MHPCRSSREVAAGDPEMRCVVCARAPMQPCSRSQESAAEGENGRRAKRGGAGSAKKSVREANPSGTARCAERGWSEMERLRSGNGSRSGEKLAQKWGEIDCGRQTDAKMREK